MQNGWSRSSGLKTSIQMFAEGVVGFYGAGSMERLPVEPAITNRIREFAELRL